MANFNIEEILGGLQEAVMVVKSIAEKQHIDNLANYFDDDGKPHTQHFQIGDNTLDVPLFIFADHSSIGVDSLEIEFEARLIPQSTEEAEPSDIKKSLLGIFNRKKKYKHNIGNLTIDTYGSKTHDKSGMGKIKIIFKKDDKPEAISRLVDQYISTLGDPKHTEVK
ncbi:DUF2589 domain-containing protein [Flavobacteriaceae bacterium]|nr:DUF2589 domain-containing protein [Flavobacteriaceae bacterium]